MNFCETMKATTHKKDTINLFIKKQRTSLRLVHVENVNLFVFIVSQHKVAP